MTSQKPQRRLPLAAAACALLLSLTACAQSAAVTPAAAGEAPAKVEKNATTGIAKLTVTEHGLARIDLKTEPVAAGTGIGRAAALCLAVIRRQRQDLGLHQPRTAGL